MTCFGRVKLDEEGEWMSDGGMYIKGSCVSCTRHLVLELEIHFCIWRISEQMACILLQ